MLSSLGTLHASFAARARGADPRHEALKSSLLVYKQNERCLDKYKKATSCELVKN